ncbi:MAG: CAP domain-containing protein [Polyangiales bacterium]
MSIPRGFGVWIGGIGVVCSLEIGCAGQAADGSSANGGSSVAPPAVQASQPAQTPGTGTSPGQTNAPAGTTPMQAMQPGAGGTGGAMAAGTAGTGGSGMMMLPAMGMAGAGGSMAPASPTTGMCPAPPAGAPDNTVKAWMAVNQTRVAAGAGCMNLVPELDKSAQAHCDYDAANASNAMCIADAHGEVMSCTGFTGADVQSREVAAGYPKALAYTEVATSFGNNPIAAVPSWIDTVWHRIPLLDPWTTDMGYGGAAGCDVIDIGRGTSSTPTNAVVVYPYDGQTNVPPAFSGSEGPAPPPPPSGWPSAYPINIYAQGLSVTEHVLTKDGDSTPIDHLWLDAQSSQVSAGLKGYFKDTAFMYGAPFELSTKYHVKIVGTHTGGALNVEWTFTTGATRPFGT